MNPSNDPNAAPQPPNGSQAVVGYGAPPQPQAGAYPTVPQQPVPQTPTGPQAAYPQPQMPPVSTAPPQPSGGVTGIPWDNMQKQKKQIWLMVAGSFAIFVGGLFIGIAALLGAVLGAFASRKARLINYKPGIILGIVGALLNAGFYLIAVLNR